MAPKGRNNAPKKKATKKNTPSKADRTREYTRAAIKAQVQTKPESSEAKLWGKLQGKSPEMIELQNKFMEEFKVSGFGFAEGSRWLQYLNKETFSQKDSYKTYEQILAAECSSTVNAKSKIKWAESLGEGTSKPGEGCGW